MEINGLLKHENSIKTTARYWS